MKKTMPKNKEKVVNEKNITDFILFFQKQNIIIKKNKQNELFNSKFATFDKIWSQIADVLSDNNVIFYSKITGDTLECTIKHVPSSTSYTSSFTLKNETSYKLASDITYYRRYALTSMLNIVVEDEDDDNVVSNSNSKEIITQKKIFDKTILDGESVIKFAKECLDIHDFKKKLGLKYTIRLQEEGYIEKWRAENIAVNNQDLPFN